MLVQCPHIWEDMVPNIHNVFCGQELVFNDLQILLVTFIAISYHLQEIIP